MFLIMMNIDKPTFSNCSISFTNIDINSLVNYNSFIISILCFISLFFPNVIVVFLD